MTIYKHASEVIEKNQGAIIVFTAGEKFFYDPSGNGYTGNWVIDPEMAEEVDKVIVYLRKKDETVNRICLGNFAGTQRSNEPGRHEIRFSPTPPVTAKVITIQVVSFADPFPGRAAGLTGPWEFRVEL